MGGRGAGSGASFAFGGVMPQAAEGRPYNIVQPEDLTAGDGYPVLENLGRRWHLLSRPINKEVAYKGSHTFYQSEPTLRWVNGDEVKELYVDGLDTTAFLAQTGIELDLHKGGFVLSKRINRFLRPYSLKQTFKQDEMVIRYMQQTSEEAKIWDGAGLVSRRMVRQMMLSGDMPASRRARLERELAHAQRVEFTIMTPNGQDKGHAMVADDLRDADGRPVDFLLPEDTKREIKLQGDEAFVGLNIVHGHNHMRLDIQSLINLTPFFEPEKLQRWLREEGELFVEGVENSRIAEAMGRIDPHATLEEVQSWHLREFFASGGQPLWFGNSVKGLMNQHLKRLNHTTLEKMRLPIPGGRHYVMPAAVGRRAGIEIEVGRGEIEIDAERGTAWVNDADWLAFQGSDSGIADVLGGADNDDALWLHPFTDYDGEQKVLAWRSPNQLGEYAIFKPTAGSHTLPWQKAGEETAVFPVADSRKLPQRIDFTKQAYLDLVDPDTAGGLGEGEAYTAEVMNAAIERALANKGALGMYCNALMLAQAVNGRLPDELPAPLEDVIDSSVKTGTDVSEVVGWSVRHSGEMLRQRTPIPRLLHKRLSFDPVAEERPPAPRPTTDHWLDSLEQGVKGHIERIKKQRDELASKAKPPEKLFASVSEEDVKLGAGLNGAYTAVLQGRKKGGHATVLERAKGVAENYLSHFPPARRRAILRGALVSVYGGEEGKSDGAAWLAAQKGQDGAGIAHETIEALREVGLLDEIVQTKSGLVIYPKEMQA